MITPAVRLDGLAEGHFYLELKGRPGRILEGARPARNFGEIAYKARYKSYIVRKFLGNEQVTVCGTDLRGRRCR